MEKSKMSSFYKRAVTALIMAPVVLGMLVAGSPYIELLFLLCAAALSWEWAKMVPNKNGCFYTTVYTAVSALAVLYPDILTVLSVVVLMTIWVIYKSRGEEHRKLLALGVPYISVGVGALMWMYYVDGNPDTVIWLVLVVWGVDVGGYVVGSTLKGPKLAPTISPNKTWSGLIGGMLFSAVLSLFFVYVILGVRDSGYLVFSTVCAALVAVIAQIGDLTESKIKRTLGLKDSSDLIPGHGGVFDRVDGLIFAAPVYLLAMALVFVIIDFVMR